jgi:hypothetical protein
MYSPVKLDGESEKSPVPEAVIDLVETGEGHANTIFIPFASLFITLLPVVVL